MKIEKCFRVVVTMLLVAVVVFVPFDDVGNLANASLSLWEDKDTATAFTYEEEISAAWGEPALFESDDFSGMYIDKDKQVVLMFVADSKGYKDAIARCESMNNRLTSKDGNLTRTLKIRSAAYSYKQLKETLQLLIDHGYSCPEVYSFGIVYEKNRVEIGLLDLSCSEKIQAEFVSLIEENIASIKAAIGIIEFKEIERQIKYCASANGYRGQI
jgi:hypothetical protein